MGCRKLTYYEAGEGIEKSPLKILGGLEEKIQSSFFCNSYTPFGLAMSGPVVNPWISGKANKFLYNAGNELNEDFSYNMYSTFYRQYDAVLGRFHSVDPLADLVTAITPYQYAFNNPVRFNDPNGDMTQGNSIRAIFNWILHSIGGGGVGQGGGAATGSGVHGGGGHGGGDWAATIIMEEIVITADRTNDGPPLHTGGSDTGGSFGSFGRPNHGAGGGVSSSGGGGSGQTGPRMKGMIGGNPRPPGSGNNSNQQQIQNNANVNYDGFDDGPVRVNTGDIKLDPSMIPKEIEKTTNLVTGLLGGVLSVSGAESLSKLLKNGGALTSGIGFAVSGINVLDKAINGQPITGDDYVDLAVSGVIAGSSIFVGTSGAVVLTFAGFAYAAYDIATTDF